MNLLPLLYALMAIVTGSFNARISWDAVADYRWAEAAAEVRIARILTARDQLMLHSGLLLIQLIMFVIGFVAFAFPPQAQPPITGSRLVGVSGLILIELILAGIAILTFEPDALPAAGPFLLLWVFAPAVAYRFSVRAGARVRPSASAL